MPFGVIAVTSDEEIRCPKCGTPLPIGISAFCDWCGYPLYQIEESPDSNYLPFQNIAEPHRRGSYQKRRKRLCFLDFRRNKGHR
jgi:NMD protein affecting ribosome stability and mRNA decay